MNSTIAKLADEFEKMEKTIASQKKMIETLMPTGYLTLGNATVTVAHSKPRVSCKPR